MAKTIWYFIGDADGGGWHAEETQPWTPDTPPLEQLAAEYGAAVNRHCLSYPTDSARVAILDDDTEDELESAEWIASEHDDEREAGC